MQPLLNTNHSYTPVANSLLSHYYFLNPNLVVETSSPFSLLGINVTSMA